MKRLILALLVVSSQAYAFDDNPYFDFDATKKRHSTMSINWITVPEQDLQRVCNTESKNRGYQGFPNRVNACTFWEGTTCTVITKNNTSMWTLGHEMRHCYQGNYH